MLRIYLIVYFFIILSAKRLIFYFIWPIFVFHTIYLEDMETEIENKKSLRWGWLPLLLLLGIVWTVQSSPETGELYATKVYPYIAAALSWISSFFPFCLSDCFIVLSIAGLLLYLVVAIWRRFSFWRIAYRVIVYLGYVYVWFYLAWGLNYFREDFYTRTGIPYATYNAENFQSFLSDYLENLNDSYVSIKKSDTLLVGKEVEDGYQRIAGQFGIISPSKVYHSKPMLSSWLMSKVGVLGYMAPFFSEFCLNKELLPVQYATSYAHELAHRLSISNEAEANLYAYLVCSRSDVPEVRFSGYFSLFPYVLGNAESLLPDEEYKAFLDSIRPEIRDLYREKYLYWSGKYSPLIGEVQHTMYNFYLKGNKIASGTANYSEVIGLLISYRQAFPKVERKTIFASF